MTRIREEEEDCQVQVHFLITVEYYLESAIVMKRSELTDVAACISENCIRCLLLDLFYSCFFSFVFRWVTEVSNPCVTCVASLVVLELFLYLGACSFISVPLNFDHKRRSELGHRCCSFVLRQRRRYMFLPVFVCLSVCLSVGKITQKRTHGFGWNVACRQMSGHGRTD